MKHYLIQVFFLFFFLLLCLSSSAQSFEKWITHPEFADTQAPRNTWLDYESSFYVPSSVQEFKLTIAADTKYWLYLNDVLVVREGGLKQGPTPVNVYADTVDVSGFVLSGTNKISIRLWHFGKDGFSHRNLKRAGIYIDGPEEFQAWKVRKASAFFVDTIGARPNYRLAVDNIGYDARKEDQADWETAVEIDTFLGRMEMRPIPQWKDFGLYAFAGFAYKPMISSGDTLILELPYNAQIAPYFEIEDTVGGQRIDIRTDNYRGGGPPNVRTTYITKPGIQEFESPGWMNGHVVRYHFPKGIKVNKLYYRETGYATERRGGFDSSDPELNSLWEKSARTLYITMRDNYMDCPDRERAQWWGDVVIELGEAFYAFDRDADLLARKGILELMRWQRKDSTIFSPVPAGNWNQELPTQMLASVGEYGIWTYYNFTADSNLIKDVYPAIKRYIHLWKVDENGLVIPRKGGWTWGDWGKKKDLYLLFQGWYGLALKGYIKMAMLEGDMLEAAWAKQNLDQLKRAVRARYWTENGFKTPEFEHMPDDRVQALAVLNDWVESSEYPVIRKNFQKVYQASPYMERYLLEALMKMGYAKDAVQRIKKRYKKMIDSDLTTLWEGWGIGAEGFGGGTYNHAWSGGPLTIMSQRIAGLEPAKPGWEEYRVAPNLAGLDRVDAFLETKQGPIAVFWKCENGKTVGDIISPENVKGELLVYKNYSSKGAPKVRIDGKRVRAKYDGVGYRYRLDKAKHHISIE